MQSSSTLFPYYVEVHKNTLDEPVRSCWEAACHRNIYLNEELKSLLLKFSDSIFAVHLPGDRIVSFESITHYFGHKNIRLMPDSCIKSLGLEKGRINPFTIEHYIKHNVQHVICSTVFVNNIVFTNNDHLNGTISFNPRLLLHFLKRVDVKLISK